MATNAELQEEILKLQKENEQLQKKITSQETDKKLQEVSIKAVPISNAVMPDPK